MGGLEGRVEAVVENSASPLDGKRHARNTHATADGPSEKEEV